MKDGTQFGSVLLMPATEARLGMQMRSRPLHGRTSRDNTIDVAKDRSLRDGSIIVTQDNSGGLHRRVAGRSLTSPRIRRWVVGRATTTDHPPSSRITTR